MLELLGRDKILFERDVSDFRREVEEKLGASKVLVVGGAGTIGQAVVKELFAYNPEGIHVVDISENNLVELVREFRSSPGRKSIDFQTYALDCGTDYFNRLIDKEGPYDYVFNLSALKHVRSEKDPFTLMRLIDVNIVNAIKLLELAKEGKTEKYFCVSTDKAANPVNMMGASKRIMELFLVRESEKQKISMARFANVAFSDGSLLHGFNLRFQKLQPITAPTDVTRYFITPEEAGRLCLLSAVLGRDREIFFPNSTVELAPISFVGLASRFIKGKGFDVHECESEDEARLNAARLISKGKWPCFFFESDTTGEKDLEEFYTANETIDLDRFHEIGIVSTTESIEEELLSEFLTRLKSIKSKKIIEKKMILELFFSVLPEFAHLETGKYLDQRM